MSNHRLSFIVMDNWRTHLSHQGHPAMVRHLNLHKSDVWCAGRIIIGNGYGEILFTSGFLPNVNGHDRGQVLSLLQTALEDREQFIHLRWK